jgi:hypothetical protein
VWRKWARGGCCFPISNRQTGALAGVATRLSDEFAFVCLSLTTAARCCRIVARFDYCVILGPRGCIVLLLLRFLYLQSTTPTLAIPRTGRLMAAPKIDLRAEAT